MEKAPLLLLHGALGTSQSFKQLIPLLSDKFDIYTFDFICHGQNANDDKVLTMNNITKQLSDFIDDNQLNAVHVFGYSMGGYAAMNLALTQPNKILSLFTFATKWDWNEESSKKEASMLNADKIEEKVPKFAAYLASLHGDNNWKKTTKKVQEMMIDLGGNNPFAEKNFSEITLPITLSVGDRDSTVSIEETIGVYRNLPNAKLFVIPNTPHAFEKLDLSLIIKMIG